MCLFRRRRWNTFDIVWHSVYGLMTLCGNEVDGWEIRSPYCCSLVARFWRCFACVYGLRRVWNGGGLDAVRLCSISNWITGELAGRAGRVDPSKREKEGRSMSLQVRGSSLLVIGMSFPCRDNPPPARGYRTCQCFEWRRAPVCLISSPQVGLRTVRGSRACSSGWAERLGSIHLGGAGCIRSCRFCKRCLAICIVSWAHTGREGGT